MKSQLKVQFSSESIVIPLLRASKFCEFFFGSPGVIVADKDTAVITAERPKGRWSAVRVVFWVGPAADWIETEAVSGMDLVQFEYLFEHQN